MVYENKNDWLINQVWQWLETVRWFSPGTPVSSTNKTDIVESGVKHNNPNHYVLKKKSSV